MIESLIHFNPLGILNLIGLSLAGWDRYRNNNSWLDRIAFVANLIEFIWFVILPLDITALSPIETMPTTLLESQLPFLVIVMVACLVGMIVIWSWLVQ